MWKCPVLLALNARFPVPVMVAAPTVNKLVPDETNDLLEAPTVIAPLTVNADVLLASVMVDTFEPTAALIVTPPAAPPELVIVPTLFTVPVPMVIAPVLPFATTMLPVPVM